MHIPAASWKKSVIRSVSLRGTIHITPKFKDNWGLLEPSGVTIVYTGKGIYIERILFDATYWQNLRTELLQYYFEHFLKFAAADFQNSAEGL